MALDGSEAPAGQGAPVALVVHRRIDAARDDAYGEWQGRVGARLAGFPGFLRREAIAPNPPLQDDWVIVEHFRDLASVREWLQSDMRRALLDEVDDLAVGNDELHIVTEDNRRPEQGASVVIATRVSPEEESAFIAWQRDISAAEARFDGFLGHKVERPIPGIQDEWVTLLTFDSEANLDAWLGSPERAEQVKLGGAFGADARITRSSYGFGFWSRQPEPDPVFQSNLLVLLMLYPIVFLWGYLVGAPLFDTWGVPVWLALFIGNVVSTQLLGWVLVPWAFKLFRWWLRDVKRWQTQVLGYAVLAALYALSMWLYSWLLTVPLG